MDVTLLSGVVRNRKAITHIPARQHDINDTSNRTAQTFLGETMSRLLRCLSGSPIMRNFNLRVHKFNFKWELVVHLFICMFSLVPFAFSGHKVLVIFPLSVWGFYNALFLIGTRRMNKYLPVFVRLRHAFKASVEDFFSPKLLPVLSLSFLLVALSLSVTGRRLGGPPLCYGSCSRCLAVWDNAIALSSSSVEMPLVIHATYGHSSCGYKNGKVMLAYYTIAQTSFLLFVVVIVSMAVCLAWRVASDEIEERQTAEDWLKREDPRAYRLREEMMKKHGFPASFIRPEGSFKWIVCGLVAALTFTLLGWHNWGSLPPSRVATLLIVLNTLSIVSSTLILHLGFFGHLLALYKRNFLRVRFLTHKLMLEADETRTEEWWNCRDFVLNNDLALDYDIGGLAVSATFVIGFFIFFMVLYQTSQHGFQAIMEPPGSYCAYACVYITACLMKLFTLATNTFEEQHKHISCLLKITMSSLRRNNTFGHGSTGSHEMTFYDTHEMTFSDGAYSSRPRFNYNNNNNNNNSSSSSSYFTNTIGFTSMGGDEEFFYDYDTDYENNEDGLVTEEKPASTSSGGSPKSCDVRAGGKAMASSSSSATLTSNRNGLIDSAAQSGEGQDVAVGDGSIESTLRESNTYPSSMTSIVACTDDGANGDTEITANEIYRTDIKSRLASESPLQTLSLMQHRKSYNGFQDLVQGLSQRFLSPPAPSHKIASVQSEEEGSVGEDIDSFSSTAGVSQANPPTVSTSAPESTQQDTRIGVQSSLSHLSSTLASASSTVDIPVNIAVLSGVDSSASQHIDNPTDIMTSISTLSTTASTSQYRRISTLLPLSKTATAEPSSVTVSASNSIKNDHSEQSLVCSAGTPPIVSGVAARRGGSSGVNAGHTQGQNSTLHGDDKRQTLAEMVSQISEPPTQELSLDEFETFALDRLQLLRGIEALRARGLDGADFSSKLAQLENKYLPFRATSYESETKSSAFSMSPEQLKDVASHFILRLAYCKSQDLRNWLIAQECHLFRFRLDRLSDSERAEFMVSNGLHFDVVSNDEKSLNKDFLLGLAGVDAANFGNTTFYQIPFTQALSLVSTRQVYVNAGKAYVPMPRLVSIITNRFKSSLARALAEASLTFHNVTSDDRIGPLLKNMNKQYIGRDDFSKGVNMDKLTPDKIEQASDKNMPLCMKHLHRGLKMDHKLKHWGRLQYGLFLKGAGLELEDAMVFWQMHFTKVLTQEQFTKGYSYMFRHMYGKEGSRKNYTPYSCLKIIMGSPPEPGAFHGCPYRHSADSQLLALLTSSGISQNESKEIATQARNGNYQLACLRHFEVTHPSFQNIPELKSEGIADHPNQWFRVSVNYHKLKTGQSLATSTSTTTVKTEDLAAAPKTEDGYAIRHSPFDIIN